jgi:nucleotide-binding universal stress UspA family protein
MLRYLGQYYAGVAAGPWAGTAFAIAIAIIFGLLLLSAINTAVVALIGVIYMMAQDGEMPKQLVRLNRHGVPFIPLVVAVLVPIFIVMVTSDFEALAGLYAIGVVGAITVNLGACTFNQQLPLNWLQRGLMGLTFLVLFVVEVTIAKTKPDALFFATCVLGVGLGLRAYSHKLSGLKTVTVTRGVAEMVVPDLPATMQSNIAEGQKMLVAARGITPVLAYALDEAALRNATLCVLYVKEVAVHFATNPAIGQRARWKDDPEANAILGYMLKAGEARGVNVVPLYAISEDAAATILDMSATLGVDFLLIGASQRSTMTHLLRGSVVTNVAENLPENIRLLIYG